MDQEIAASMKITIYVVQFHVIAIISMVKTLMNSVIPVVTVTIMKKVIGMKIIMTVMIQLKILNTESMPKLTQQSVIFSAMWLKDVFPVPLKDAFNSEIIH